MIREISFRYTPEGLGAFDRPDPPIPHLSGVIIFERGGASVAVWDEQARAFVHPVNQHELAEEALDLMLQALPELTLGSRMQVFTCPQELVARFHFGDWHDQWLAQAPGPR